MELTSNSFANSFRFLAAELRDLRKMQGSDLNNGKPSDALMEFSALMFRLNTLVVDAEGLLPTTLSSWLADNRKERAEGGGNVWELCFHEFESLVGYDPADAAITWEEPGYLNDDGHWYGSRRYFELTPGPIADLLPGVFLPIDGTVYGDGKLLDSARELYGNSYYKILGYMAVACDVLGKCVENRAAQGDDDNDGNAYPDDGVHQVEKAFVWGGVRFERLTSGMMRVLRLLHDERRKGASSVSLEAIRKIAKVGVGGGMKSQVFKLNRKGWPPVHPVSDLVADLDGGFYSLIDPAKVPGIIPIRS